MKTKSSTYELPKLKKGINQTLNKEKLSSLAEKVRKILIKEGKLADDQDFSSRTNNFCY